MVPEVLSPPDLPFTSQVTAVFVVFETAAVNCFVKPDWRVELVGVTATVTAFATVAMAAPDFVVSTVDTADTVTAAGEGTAAGALYSPAVEMVPTVVLPLATPLTFHVTVLVVVFWTVAVNCWVALGGRRAAGGLTLIRIAVEVVMVVAAAPDLEPSALETAETVTLAGLGTAAGAVKRPAVVMTPTRVFPPLTPLTFQVTAVLVEP
jgi:hypothetical protein